MLSLIHNQPNNSRSLLRKQWDKSHRLRKYTFYGILLSGVGLGVLYVAVSHLSVNRFLAQMLVVPAVMAFVSYFVHRRKAFGDRELPGYTSLRRYALVRLAGMGVSRISFVVLVVIMGLPYLFASALIITGLAGPTYLAHRDWSFVQNHTYKTDKE